MKIFTKQIELASEKLNSNILILGDANLDSNKWDNPKFLDKKVSKNLRNVLDRNGFQFNKIGNTYFADHAQANGNVAESRVYRQSPIFSLVTKTHFS